MTVTGPVPPHPERPVDPGPGAAPLARDRLNLIELIAADAVASDYAGAVPEARPSSRRQQALVVAIATGMTGFVLALGLSARILNAPVIDEQKAALQERIRTTDARQDELTAEVTRLREEAQVAREEALESTLGGLALAAQVRAYEVATGYTAVLGPGMVVTLSDAELGEEGEPTELERVLDSDVQRAVNGLWAAGAEAVAVNGQRMSARTAIRSAAGAILVNYRPLTPPYFVEAIGPERLEQDFLATQDAAELRGISEQFGIGFTTESVDEVQLAAATSPLPEQAEVIVPGEGEDG
jgi:uncharacterized protein YlxW (UPF0749 family)